MYRTVLAGIVSVAMVVASSSSVGAQYSHLNRLRNSGNYGYLDLSSDQRDAIREIVETFKKQTRDADLKVMGLSPVDFDKVRDTPEEQEFVERMNSAYTNKQLLKRLLAEHKKISKQRFDDLRKVLAKRQLELLDRVVIEKYSPRALFILAHNPRLQELVKLTDSQKKDLDRIYWSIYDHVPAVQSEKAEEIRAKASEEFRRVLTPAQRKLLTERRVVPRGL